MLDPNRKGSMKKMVSGLLLGHVLSLIISLMASSFLGRLPDGLFGTVTVLVCTGFALFFSYHEGWIAGNADKLYIQKDIIKFNPYKGFAVGAVGAIPGFIIALLAFLTCVTPLKTVTIMGQELLEFIYRIWFWSFYWVFSSLKSHAILHFVPVLAMPLACGVGYICGVNKIRIFDHVFYKKDK